jgi:hypothetical protein
MFLRNCTKWATQAKLFKEVVYPIIMAKVSLWVRIGANSLNFHVVLK